MCLIRSFSPLRYLTWNPFQVRPVDTIETCRMFEDSYDFWDEFGDGWATLAQPATAIGGHGEEGKAWAEFFSWFVQSSNHDIKAYYSKYRVNTLICDASPEMFESIGLLLELGPPGTIDDKSVTWGITPLIHSIQRRHFDKSKRLLALGADPHQSSFSWYSNRVESPLSLAMYLSWAFCSFRDALVELNFHAEDFVRRELEQGGPLLKDGWRAETLTALLEYDFDFEPPRQEIQSCNSCRFSRLFSEITVQPYWQNILERIKNGTHVQNDRSDTLDMQSSSSQTLSISATDSLPNTTNDGPLPQDYVIPGDQSNQSDEEPVTTESPSERLAPEREELWCIWCWRHFKETGRLDLYSYGEDSSEDDFSPFLFNT